MLDKLLLLARHMGASDLHLTPASVPMVRVDVKQFLMILLKN